MERKSPIKRVPKEKIAILHHCSEVDRISRIELILVGNGHPEDGYVYKVIEMGKQVEDINKKLTGICGIVTELHEESIGKKAGRKTAEEIKKEKRENIYMWIKTITLVVVTLAFISASFLGFKNWQLSKASYSNTFMTNKRLDQMDNSGLTRAIHEYKVENNILKFDTVNRNFDEVDGIDPYEIMFKDKLK